MFVFQEKTCHPLTNIYTVEDKRDYFCHQHSRWRNLHITSYNIFAPWSCIQTNHAFFYFTIMTKSNIRHKISQNKRRSANNIYKHCLGASIPCSVCLSVDLYVGLLTTKKSAIHIKLFQPNLTTIIPVLGHLCHVYMHIQLFVELS